MGQKIAGRALVVGTMAALVVGAMATHALRRAVASPPSSAEAVTAFVRNSLTARVLLVEGALAAADAAAPGYNVPPHGSPAVSRTLEAQALVLLDAARGLTTLTPPPLGPQLARQLNRLLEDLALCGEQLAALLQDTTAALAGATEPDQVLTLGYWPGAHRAVALLRRAEGWLEAINHETGAQAVLPGFAPGTPPLEKALGLL
jgi:hypothetical protein